MSVRKFLSKTELENYLAQIRMLRVAFDLLEDHVIITDANAIILYANKAVERNTGFSTDEIIGKNPGDLWGGNMPKETYEKMWDTIKNKKQPFVLEVKNKRKDGGEYWQELHISPVLDENGNARFFIGIELNITDRKKREEFRDEFISVVSHQLRNPLAVIRWTLDRLLARGGLTSDQKVALEQIYMQNQGLAGSFSVGWYASKCKGNC